MAASVTEGLLDAEITNWSGKVSTHERYSSPARVAVL